MSACAKCAGPKPRRFPHRPAPPAAPDGFQNAAPPPRQKALHSLRWLCQNGGTIQTRGQLEPAIRWQGRRFPLSAACALALQEHRLGHLETVVQLYDLILAKVPGYAAGHNNRGAVLQQLGRHDQALAAYDRALALKPAYANAHYNRGAALKKLLRFEEALASYDRAIALQPHHAEAHNNRGVLLQELKRYREALACYDRVIALQPNHAAAHNNRGVVLVSQGKMAEAEQMFLQAAQLNPGFPDPLFNLANIRNYPHADAPEVHQMRALIDRPGLPPADKEHLLFSLGKVLDDCGRYDEAFDCFRQANEIRNRSVAYDPRLVNRTTDEIIRVFTPELLAQPSPFASASPLPIFIVGMPRSGTTLLAAILSNHPAVASAGELSLLGDLALGLQAAAGAHEPYPAAVRQWTAGAAQQLIAHYEKRLRRDAGPEIARVIDKNPLNFRHAGLIRLLFPQAHILHCVRDARDTCLSNYFQRFPLHLDYCFDLGNIAHFYRDYERLMAHWRTVPTVRILDIHYEDMVLHTAQAARAAVEFVGLDWDERCLVPQTNRYAVETASQWQVRQPIYQRSIGRWRHYEKHLGPLAEFKR